MTVWWDFSISVEAPDGADETWAKDLLDAMIRPYLDHHCDGNWAASINWEIIGDADEDDDWEHAEDCDLGHDCNCRDDA